MSIIVAVTKNNKTVMAADTLTSFGDAQRVSGDNCPTEKIRRLGAVLLGGTGWARGVDGRMVRLVVLGGGQGGEDPHPAIDRSASADLRMA